jgi:uncharacterized membrane protein YidH (DUF202 family)
MQDTRKMFKKALRNHSFLVFLILNLLLTLVCVGVVLFAINPSGAQIDVRYDYYASEFFLKDRWWYLIGLAIFPLIVFTTNTFISAKLNEEKGEKLTKMFMILTTGILLIFLLITIPLLKVVALQF